ncbi:MAG: 23S rRNA (guanosine(2251)-2'-O)-methyltransferase RlmB [Magnetococcales bacterium]|nr:23S rRNA (guanosine(2251)-2'-O)-methyltransferase RlmB [Magnetococcales bacterium]
MVAGINPVLALLREAGRPVESVIIAKGAESSKLGEIARLARERGLKVRYVERVALDRTTDGAVHQGVAARAGVRLQPEWSDFLAQSEATEKGLVVLLDGVEDPHNLGAVIRSAEAFGALGVVTARERSAPLSEAALKASAGSAERLDVVRVVNLVRAMEELKEAGYQVLGLASDGDVPLHDADLKGKVALVVGGEAEGLRRLVRQRCDRLLSIPLAPAVESLNLAVAAGVALHEIRRRGQG